MRAPRTDVARDLWRAYSSQGDARGDTVSRANSVRGAIPVRGALTDTTGRAAEAVRFADV